MINLILVCLYVHAQNEDQYYQQKLEELSETSSDEIDFSDLTAEMIELKQHPINLNEASREELRILPFLNEKQVDHLILYKETYGEIFSLNELEAINGFDSLTIRQILPFIRIAPPVNRNRIRWPDVITASHGQFIIRYQQIIQKQHGYSVPDSDLKVNPNSGYSGSPQKYFFRFDYQYNNRLSIGFTGEKDPGEQFFRGDQKDGMDYYAGYFCMKNSGILKSLVIGNFKADFGQGLTFSTGVSFGSLPSSGNLRRYASRIKPSMSVSENTFLRGIAATIALKKIEISAFYSWHRRDGNISIIDSISGKANMVTSFQETGYHRLPSELVDKNAVGEEIFGGNIEFRNNYFSLGITGSHCHWSATLSPACEVYSQFAFKGSSNMNAGIDFQAHYRSIYGFGEISGSQNDGLAWLAGIQVNPDPGIHFSMICRDYQRSYQNLFSNAIGQNSKNSNEKGILLNFSASLTSKISLSGFIDLFRFPWLKYSTDFISRGTEYSFQSDYSLNKQVIMNLKYREKASLCNDNSNHSIHQWINRQYRSLCYRIDWRITSTTQLKNRVEFIQTSGEGCKTENGYFVCQDIVYRYQRIPLNFTCRYALFNADSYDSRIYAFENDVLYSTSVPVLDGTGIRCFLLVNWEPYRWLAFWLRYAQTFYSDRQKIGTGLEMIDGNLKSEIKFQIQFKF